MTDAKPYPKSQQLARGQRRTSRTVATRSEKERLRAAKDGPCRICGAPPPNELHHLIPRARGGGDVEANLVPLCVVCHDAVTLFRPEALRDLLEALSDDEYEHVAAFGVGRIFAGALT
jgi:5-methylcytosine-specific restriction endonuclease McrA